MPATIHRPATFTRPATTARPATASRKTASAVTPSIIDPASAQPFTLEQELQPFGTWVSDTVWVPPKDSSREMAGTMLRQTRPLTSRDKRWEAVVDQHRNDFTQVREIDLFAASIRLPKGRFFVTVTEEKDFHKITDTIPACVQTRLDEFMAGPLKRRGAKVYYLKPLCVELGDELILTTPDDLTAAISQIQKEVFAHYRRTAVYRRPLEALAAAANLGLALPRGLINYAIERKQKTLAAYQARLEFQRRKTAFDAAKTHAKVRTNRCSMDDMLELTSPLDQADVIEQYCIENELSAAKREQLLRIAAGSLPWFVALSVALYAATSMAATALMYTAPPVAVCDPAFVAALPGSNGVVLKSATSTKSAA
ncbi:MAG: hypothetical protein SGJ20_00385 [Planctomycetota bacterium]|nr:hypothetical protein [Planctomycetota bacterium]